ncbi:hypothetical protein LZ31DRAFT_255843 [Colletotrichum somersetense]|nr:hypothetical protein LZ31DRAFT_255843 [Colletotrichum somersetense]
MTSRPPARNHLTHPARRRRRISDEGAGEEGGDQSAMPFLLLLLLLLHRGTPPHASAKTCRLILKKGSKHHHLWVSQMKKQTFPIYNHPPHPAPTHHLHRLAPRGSAPAPSECRHAPGDRRSTFRPICVGAHPLKTSRPHWLAASVGPSVTYTRHPAPNPALHIRRVLRLFQEGLSSF